MLIYAITASGVLLRNCQSVTSLWSAKNNPLASGVLHQAIFVVKPDEHRPLRDTVGEAMSVRVPVQSGFTVYVPVNVTLPWLSDCAGQRIRFTYFHVIGQVKPSCENRRAELRDVPRESEGIADNGVDAQCSSGRRSLAAYRTFSR